MINQSNFQKNNFNYCKYKNDFIYIINVIFRDINLNKEKYKLHVVVEKIETEIHVYNKMCV